MYGGKKKRREKVKHGLLLYTPCFQAVFEFAPSESTHPRARQTRGTQAAAGGIDFAGMRTRESWLISTTHCTRRGDFERERQR